MARSWVAAGSEQLGGPQDEQGGGDVAELEGRHADHQAAEASGQHWPDAQPQRSAFPLLGSGGVCGWRRRWPAAASSPGMMDRAMAVRVPTSADQGQGEQGAGDGAEVVHGPLEPVGPAVARWRDDVGQQGVAGRNPQPPGGPGAGPQHRDLPDAVAAADQAGEDSGGGVAGDAPERGGAEGRRRSHRRPAGPLRPGRRTRPRSARARRPARPG